MTAIKKFIHDLSDLIYPRECFYCGKTPCATDAFSGQMCETCAREISKPNSCHCPRCGIHVPDIEFIGELGCPACCSPDLKIKGIFSTGEYHAENSIGKMILSIKHGGRIDLVGDLARMMANVLKACNHDFDFHAVTAVPLHRLRFFKRGYNQAELIGIEIAKQFNLPFYEWMIKRIKRTKPQSGSPAQRKMNIKNAFTSGGVCKNARLLLIDDVYTTGATTSECARILVNSGC